MTSKYFSSSHMKWLCPVIAVLLNASIQANSRMLGPPCNTYTPTETEIEQLKSDAEYEFPEQAELKTACLSKHTFPDPSDPIQVREEEQRSFNFIWPLFRREGELWFYQNLGCAKVENQAPICAEAGTLAKWSQGKLFKYDKKIYEPELNELAMVIKDVFDAQVQIKRISKHTSSNSINWRTGKHIYSVIIEDKTGTDSHGHQIVRNCKSIDRCEWDVSNAGRVIIRR